MGREPPPDGTPADLLLSLLGRMRRDIVTIAIPARMNVFYGFGRVRFFSRQMTEVRPFRRVVDARMIGRDIIHVVYRHRLEPRQEEGPVLLADAINRLHPS